MLKKCTAILLSFVLTLGVLPFQYIQAGTFKDVPEKNWAYTDIEKAVSYGIIKNNTDGIFGLEKEITRSEFISMLNKAMGFKTVTQNTPSFTDVDKSKSYYPDIETAVKNGVLSKLDKTARPEESLTKEEMAVMLIKACGFDSLNESTGKLSSSFTDVTQNQGYITMAVDFGLLNPKSDTAFEPKKVITKEEAVSSLVRVYEKTHQKLKYLHGFYAFSSYSQKDIALKMDQVSYGWSRLDYHDDGSIVLNTTSKDNNEWRVPEGYEQIVTELDQAGVDQNLSVFFSAVSPAMNLAGNPDTAGNLILNDPERRSMAVDAIIEELSISYQKAGKNPYTGVTIDFENLRGPELKQSFVLFLTELKQELDKIEKGLNVAVHPVLSTGAYYDGYDYRAIGDLADQVILMAHDYEPKSLSEQEMLNAITTMPLTPYDQVYYALKEITDENTGVLDKNKIVLAVSMSTAGWSQNSQGSKIKNSTPISPVYSLIHEAGKGGGIINYSTRYRNPSIQYQKDGDILTVWYEDARSIEDKIKLAQMFDINGLSIWRIGTVPNYKTENGSDITFLNIWDTIKKYH